MKPLATGDPLTTGDPAHIGDYQLLSRLGSGSMGAVYLGRSRGGRVVAVKVARAELAEDGEFRERFRREVRMAAAVGGFWTATVVDADTEAERPWLATEYVPGPTLQQAVAEQGPLPERSVRGLAAGLAEALQAVHAAGLVHRDLKPSNVLLAPDGPRVIDFGISRAVTGSALTATGMFFGTPGFFSPEQTAGGDIGPPSDMFSLGAVLTFAATGHGPFGNDNTAAMLYRVVHAPPEMDGIDPALREFIEPCLAKEPSARPAPHALLDRLGPPSAQGEDWLPAGVTSLIAEHTAQVQQLPAERPAPVAAERPDTRTFDDEPAAEPDSPGPSRHGSARHDSAGGAEFATGGRASATVSVILCALLVCGFAYLGAMAPTIGAQIGRAAQQAGMPQSQTGVTVNQAGVAAGTIAVIGMALFGLRAALSLVRALLPELRLLVNAAGLTVARGSRSRSIEWPEISRVGIVGRGRKRRVVAWLAEGVPIPRATLWHRFRRQHGGIQLYRVGRSRGWLARRRETKQLRAALSWYGPRAYDDRL